MREQIISAASAAGAMEVAKRIHIDMIGSGTNAIYLIDTSGHEIWSLRLGDVWLERALVEWAAAPDQNGAVSDCETSGQAGPALSPIRARSFNQK